MIARRASQNQVGSSCRVSHFTRAGALAPGGAEPALSSERLSAARANTLRSARERSLSVFAFAADALRGVYSSSAPPRAKAPAVLKWDMQQHVPTWFIKDFAFGASRLHLSSATRNTQPAPTAHCHV